MFLIDRVKVHTAGRQVLRFSFPQLRRVGNEQPTHDDKTFRVCDLIPSGTDNFIDNRTNSRVINE